ncbi:hypothetical protein C8R43DRAFT_1160175 [Mycena crocata]|nr:hypothetical protein C8R43DRAFT_1160175 [Mycena crocata]
MSHIAFPQNPSRPTAQGRGSRKAIPTAGLINHDADREKNQAKGQKAKETRDRNKLLQAAQAASAPVDSPFTAPQMVPSTPATAFGQPHGQTGMVRPPLSNIHPQNSSPFSSMPSPSPAIRPEPAFRMPQNYQPTYPDFSNVAGSVPQTPDRQPVDTTLFRSMLAQMSEQQIEALAAGFSINGSVIPGGGDYNSDYNGASTAYGPGGDDGGNNAQDDFDNHPHEDSGDEGGEQAWNQDAGDDAGETDDDDLHVNAQSSLDVTMQDVNVERRKRKRQAPVSEVEEDSETESITSDDRARRVRRSLASSPKRPGRKQPRKKRAHRRQKSRSIKEISAERQRIVKLCFYFIQMLIATFNAWPTASESGLANAVDDDFEQLLELAWAYALEHLKLRPGDVDARTTEETNLIISRISQLRGAVVAAAAVYIPSAYGFVNPHDSDAPEDVEKGFENNRQLVDDLQGTFMYTNPKETEDLATACHHPIFQKILNAAFFAKTGLNSRAKYFEKDEELPVETLALIMDAVSCGIDRWKTGEYCTKSAPFEAKTYGPVHDDCRLFLNSWVAEYKSNLQPVNLASTLLKEMLTKARRAAGAPIKPVQARSRFPMHVFTQKQ